MDEGVRHFPPRLLDDTREGRAGNLHLLGCLFLVTAVEIGKPKRFELVQRQNDFLQ